VGGVGGGGEVMFNIFLVLSYVSVYLLEANHNLCPFSLLIRASNDPATVQEGKDKEKPQTSGFEGCGNKS